MKKLSLFIIGLILVGSTAPLFADVSVYTGREAATCSVQNFEGAEVASLGAGEAATTPVEEEATPVAPSEETD